MVGWHRYGFETVTGKLRHWGLCYADTNPTSHLTLSAAESLARDCRRRGRNPHHRWLHDALRCAIRVHDDYSRVPRARAEPEPAPAVEEEEAVEEEPAPAPEPGPVVEGKLSVEEEEERRKGFHCLSKWDGNHDGLEVLIRAQLNDPGSMETIETRITPPDADGDHIIQLDFTAKNAYGGRVRSTAHGWVSQATCVATLVLID